MTPLAPFVLALLAAMLIDAWARRHAPRASSLVVGRRSEAYIGGEAAPARASRPSFHLFHLAIFYTVLHVSALVLLAATGAPLWLSLAYLAVVALALWAVVV